MTGGALDAWRRLTFLPTPEGDHRMVRTIRATCSRACPEWASAPPDRPWPPSVSCLPHQVSAGEPEVGVDVVRDLRAHARGDLLAPRDGAYAAAHAGYNALANGQPAYIFRPADVPDIAAAVRLPDQIRDRARPLL